MKKHLLLALFLLFGGFLASLVVSPTNTVLAQENENETAQILVDQENAENKARTEFERLQKNPRKNLRRYKITLGEIQKYLETPQDPPVDLADENGAIDLEKIKFEDLKKGLKQYLADQARENKSDETSVPEADPIELTEKYDELTNLFRDAQENTVQEVRYSIANGGILPGSRTVEGSRYLGETVIPKFVNTLLVLALSLSTLIIIVGGGMYLFSYGDDELKKKGKNAITWAIVGSVITILAFTIVKFVINLNFEI